MDADVIGKRADLVRAKIRRACERCGRDPADVTIIAVSKTFPHSAIAAAHEAGLRHFGENKAQEFEEKFDVLGPVLGDHVTWHFIGHLQRNKVKLVAGKAQLIHGVDSVRLARALAEYAEREDLLLRCLIQINVSGEESKFGLRPGALPSFLREVSQFDRVTFEGLMTLASPTDDETRLRLEFGRLRESLDAGRQVIESMSILSMGMSSDFEIAVQEGATHVRLGSILFGPRGE